jgi:hypothetical protein
MFRLLFNSLYRIILHYLSPYTENELSTRQINSIQTESSRVELLSIGIINY